MEGPCLNSLKPTQCWPCYDDASAGPSFIYGLCGIAWANRRLSSFYGVEIRLS